MDNKIIMGILDTLDELYPFDFKCFLEYEEPWQLLIATILSAQCTDERVNQVTKVLFKKYPSLTDFAGANHDTLAKDIHSTGFFRTKSKNIIESASLLLTQHKGQLPSDIKALTALPGVGRKTANVVRGHIFRIPSIVVDTHVKRVSNKLGLTSHSDPEKIEFELMEILPESHWIQFNQQVISHGRKVCIARRPQCAICGLSKFCASFSSPSIESDKAKKIPVSPAPQ